MPAPLNTPTLRRRASAAWLFALPLALCALPAWAQTAPAQPAPAGDAVVYERIVSTPGAAAVTTVTAVPPVTAAPAQAAPEPDAAPKPAQSAGQTRTTRAEGNGVWLHQQDAGSRVDELRVRGQTQSITVTPAGTMPAYEVTPGGSQPHQGQPNRAADGTNGPRRWKIGQF